MTCEIYINAFVRLGERLSACRRDENFKRVCEKAVSQNSWFSLSDIYNAAEAICKQMLDENKLNLWVKSCIPRVRQPRNVLIIMAGNIPLVGFFDLMCVVISGHRAIVKTSSKDRVLMGYIIEQLKDICIDIPIDYYNGTQPVDALVAMGGDNAIRLFDEKYPAIPKLLRASRSSVAVIDGTETEEELHGLAKDIMLYSGLGCRNVGNLFIPYGYDISNICKALNNTSYVNSKFINNYKQTKAILTMDKTDFYDCGTVLLVNSARLPEAISQVNYTFYSSESELREWLNDNDSNIQCVVGHLSHPRSVGFGCSQTPSLFDYPDGVDTMKFLSEI